jgi:hypothetical protein
MSLFVFVPATFAASCSTDGVNIKGENAGTSSKAYAYNHETCLTPSVEQEAP